MADADLKEIRESFTEDEANWKDAQDARAEDIKALSPDSTWDRKDREAREEAGRPCLSFDELGQYVNQLVNDVRENKRAIEVNPAGDTTSEAQARFLGALIRQIEDRSNAQLAYTRMFEDAAQGGYGFLRIIPRYVQQSVRTPSAQSFDQELIIEPVHNPDLITPGYFTRPDFSDCERWWVHERFIEAAFKRRFGKKSKIHELKGLTSEVGPSWCDDKGIWVRELWETRTKPATLVLLRPKGYPDAAPMAFWQDTIEDAEGFEVVKERVVEQPYICQTITNGVEILEERKDWPGRYLPFVGCTGKILWSKASGEQKRVLLSLIRKAIDPQQLYNYYRTQEAEIVGMTPKVPWFYYEGTMDPTQEADLLASNVVPVGAIRLKAKSNAWPAEYGLPPIPQRPAYEPPIQALEMGAESTRRGIQAATGTGFLPTQAQRVNEKSGVALREIATSAQKGAYHFVDHYEHALRRTGVILVDAIPHYYDTPRTISVKRKDDTPINVRINDPKAPPVREFGDGPILLRPEDEFDVTVSSGPSFESERDRTLKVAQELIASRPEIFQVIGPEVIRMLNLGPLGDQLAESLEAMQPPAIQALKKGQSYNAQAQAMQAQLQQAQQMIQALQTALKSGAHLEQVKQQGALALKQLDGQIKLALAELQGDQKLRQLAAQVSADIDTREDEQAHELALKGADVAQQARAAERSMLHEAMRSTEEPPLEA